jgi:hypothetical protein
MAYNVIFDPSMNIRDATKDQSPNTDLQSPNTEDQSPNTEDQSPNTILTVLIAFIIICVLLALAFLFSSKSSKRRR